MSMSKVERSVGPGRAHICEDSEGDEGKGTPLGGPVTSFSSRGWVRVDAEKTRASNSAEAGGSGWRARGALGSAAAHMSCPLARCDSLRE